MHEKHFYAIIICCCFLSFLFILFTTFRSSSVNPSTSRPLALSSNAPLIVFSEGSAGWLGENILVMPPCDVQCMFSDEPMDMKKADALVWHVPQIQLIEIQKALGTHKLPSNGRQLFVSFSLEPDCDNRLDKARELVDIEMTYRKNIAEIWAPYIPLQVDELRTRFDQSEKWLSNGQRKHTAPVAMFVSNCNAYSDRLEITKALMEIGGLQVDSFGACLNNAQHPNNIMHSATSKISIMREYLFVLAFENCITHDYVTEKIYHVFKAGAVPIYMGAPNIREFVPSNNSVVFVDEFDVNSDHGIKQLANHIKALANDRKAYETMLEWKNDESIFTSPNHPFAKLIETTRVDSRCKLCRLVHYHRNQFIDSF